MQSLRVRGLDGRFISPLGWRYRHGQVLISQAHKTTLVSGDVADELLNGLALVKAHAAQPDYNILEDPDRFERSFQDPEGPRAPDSVPVPGQLPLPGEFVTIIDPREALALVKAHAAKRSNQDHDELDERRESMACDQ